MTLDIKNRITGDIRRLIDFNGLNRERGVNGEKLISLNIFDTDKNAKSYPYVEEENTIIFDNEEYVIKEVGRGQTGKRISLDNGEYVERFTHSKEVICIHKFFCDMREQRIYSAYTQSFTFTAILNMIFDGTGYTFEVIGSFLAEDFENFGGGKDKLELFNDVLNRYSAEFEILSGGVIRLSKRKGSTVPTFKLLYNHNIKTIDYKQNTNNLSTYIKGYGKKKEHSDYLSSTSIPYGAKSPSYYWDAEANAWALEEIGRTFTFSFTGTGFNYKALTTFLGGKLQFVIDNSKNVTISTYQDVTAAQKTFEVVRGLENKSHYVRAIFKGKDSNNPYTNGTGVNAVNHLLDGNIIGVYEPLVGDGIYEIVSDYTSPNASSFPADTPDGLRHAPPIVDERYHTVESLDEALQEALIDTPEVSITLSFADMRKYGYPHAVPIDGDDVYLIHEPLDLDITVRLIRIVEYFNQKLEPIDTDVTLGNPRATITSQVGSIEKTVGQILNPNGRLNESYLPDQVKRLTAVLLAAETEVEFSNAGIISRNKDNPNFLTLLNSAGFGISKDGGVTFNEAITAEGFVLTAGAIGQLAADNIRVGAQTGSDIPALDFNSNGLRASTTDPNKYVELNGNGVEIHDGAIKWFGADGREYVINGYMNLNYAVFPYEPFNNPWDSDITVSGRWWTTTTSTSERTIGAYVFRHEGRYLRVKVNHILGQDNTGSGGFYLRGFGSQASIDKIQAGVVFSNYLEENGYDDIVIDLGVPTYEEMTFYLKLRSGTQGMSVFLRKTRFYQED